MINKEFDSIDISKLKSDKINKNDMERLKKFSKIKDLSNTIQFDDEWKEK